jgi:hypothetical protein
MEITRNETGKYEDIPSLKDFDITGITGEDYTAIALALHYGLEHYEKLEFTDPETVSGKTYHQMKALHELMTDYNNHNRTFNGKKVRSYSDRIGGGHDGERCYKPQEAAGMD